ncbi:hypothetical protein MC885_016815 [Smutsia gigantea]|nr:hypothetical protein MC885_016815 [Smutsia gigantea]
MGAGGEKSWGTGEGKGAKPREVTVAGLVPAQASTRPPLPQRPPRWAVWN